MSYFTRALCGVLLPAVLPSIRRVSVDPPPAAVWLADLAQYKQGHVHSVLWPLVVWGRVLNGVLDALCEFLASELFVERVSCYYSRWTCVLLSFFFKSEISIIHKSRHNRTLPSLSGMVYNYQLIVELVLLHSMHLPFPMFLKGNLRHHVSSIITSACFPSVRTLFENIIITAL